MKRKSKILAAAIGLLAFSTAASITGTVAWFTASNVVSAEGIYVMAEKEDGIVMANEDFDSWSTAVQASHDGTIGSPAAQAGFIPTSTKDASTWAHASAVQADDELAVESSYALVTPTLNGSDTGIYKASINNVDKNIYLLNTFYLKSASTDPISGNLYSYVKAEVVGTSVSVELNKALRVLVKYGSDVNVYAPINGATTSYSVCTAINSGDNPATTDVTETSYPTKESVSALTGATTNLLKSNVTIPANNPDSVNVNTFPVNVYCYFEGEDAACFSNNIKATLDQLSITVKLGTSSTL